MGRFFSRQLMDAIRPPPFLKNDTTCFQSLVVGMANPGSGLEEIANNGTPYAKAKRFIDSWA